ncbi:MAG: alcohol dehydrogenase catalytic domain-containing protein [Bacillota bacterium]
MKAAVLKAPYKVEIEEQPEPKLRSDEVLIRVKATGICGSDVHAYQGYHPRRQPPAVLGHELAGEIVARGDAVNSLKVGDRVTVLPQKKCGSCYPCSQGWATNMCDSKTLLGTNKWAGSFAEYIAAPQELVYTIPHELNYELGALTEPLAVGIHALNRVCVKSNESVLIVGAGPIGLMCQIAAKKMGVKDIIVADLSDMKLETAKILGASTTINNSSENLASKIEEQYGKKGVDVAIVAAGVPDLITQAFAVVRKQGRIVLVGQFDNPGVIDIEKSRLKEQLITGSSTYTEKDFLGAISLLTANNHNFSSIVSHRIRLEEIGVGIDLLLNNNKSAIKVIVEI